MPNRQRQRRPRGGKSAFNVRRELSDGPSYIGQQVFPAMLPTTQLVSNTVVTTGLISDSFGLSTSQIAGFSARFGSTFDEYRIVRVRAKIRPLAVSTGVTRFFFDEKSAAAPTVSDAAERVGLTLPNNSSSPSAFKVMTWSARDLLDLQYTAIGTVVTPVYFKVYTSATGFGAPITATALWMIEFDFFLEFRGLRAA